MWSIFVKEIAGFFSSLIGYVVAGLFLLFLGLKLFVWPQSSILEGNYATLEQFFINVPDVFAFLIPAITMRSFAEENQNGTIELLATRPLRDGQIVMGKFLAALALACIALLPTLLYYLTVYQLGAPKGNLDAGAVAGSYIGLLFLAAAFTAIGLLASALNNNQIVAFLMAVLLCVVLHWGFDLLSSLPMFTGRGDDILQRIGMNAHYMSISEGVIDSRDVVYFSSVILLFLAFTVAAVNSRKW